MARSPTEQIRELEKTLVALQKGLEYAEENGEDKARAIRDLERIAAELKEEQTRSARDTDRAMSELRQELALVRQRLDDHLKRMELWSGRLWTLVIVLIGAVMSLASGLIVALSRKGTSP